MTVSKVQIGYNRAVANEGTARGGGIRVGPFGTLDLTDSHITGNTADAPNGTAQGGGLDNPDGGTLTARRNKVLRNTVTAKDGTAQGGGLYHGGGTTGLGTTTLEENTITHNRAGDGGGIFKASGILTLNGDIVRHNQPNNCSPVGSVPGCTGRRPLRRCSQRYPGSRGRASRVRPRTAEPGITAFCTVPAPARSPLTSCGDQGFL
ncbi:hypothetical protein [Streptomyces sp. NPDC090131]|uniref:hypothetical protein n=1 Tax=Streptomyces sp. NPDC090131 TaxID=3365954 RepID=UPI00382090A7